jgi:acetoin utilization deacetylase AcuC-like enzyme
VQPRLHYCDHYGIALPEGHKFPMEKYRMVRDQLAVSGRFRFECAPFATQQQLLRVHDRDYVHHFLQGSLSAQAIRRIGFPWSPALVQRTLASVGGAVAAAEDAFTQGFGGNLAGGTHHAFVSEGSGFCVFNDIAVAIEHLKATRGLRRVAVVDLDVHQGDGTASIYEDDPGVLTFSMHGAHNFPFRKQRSKLDVPLPNGTEDDAFLDALYTSMPQVLAFEPELIFFQAGVDGLREDKLGKLALTPQGLQQRNHFVLQTCRRLAIPVVICMGGGYSLPIHHSVQAHAQVFLDAAAVFQERIATMRNGTVGTL